MYYTLADLPLNFASPVKARVLQRAALYAGISALCSVPALIKADDKVAALIACAAIFITVQLATVCLAFAQYVRKDELKITEEGLETKINGVRTQVTWPEIVKVRKVQRISLLIIGTPLDIIKLSGGDPLTVYIPDVFAIHALNMRKLLLEGKARWGATPETNDAP